MPGLKQVAGTLLRSVQSLVLYRHIGRKLITNITYREATEEDQMAVHHLLNPNGDTTNIPQQSDQVTNYVAIHHGKCVGFIQLVRHPMENFPYTGYWLFSLQVKSLCQGLGVGEGLSRMVIQRAEVEGAAKVDLLVFQDNWRAISLYCKLGCEKYDTPELDPQLENEFLSTGRRRILMRKQLASLE
jgi:ribosomal protein S18 acetylase RimI-like enzyme